MSSSSHGTKALHKARRRWWMRLLQVLCVAALALLGAELGLRYLLFSGGSLAAWMGGGSLRRAELYGGPRVEAYWRLKTIFAADRAHSPERVDTALGWVSRRFEPETYVHRHEERLNGRRPLLLYGDSFAYCKVPAESCWGGILERSELAGELAVLNYGVEGFGLDQIVMTMLETVDRWLEHDPVVVLSLLVDDDLDRSMLGFRGWAKPRFRIASDGSLERAGLVLSQLDPVDAARPVGIPSYLWQLALHGSALLPQQVRDRLRGREQDVARTKDLNRRILALARAELEARGVEHFVVVFHGERMLRIGRGGNWREPFLYQTLEELGLPYVSSRTSFQSDRRLHQREIEDYFLGPGPGVGHYAPLGNEVAFDAIRRGLAGLFDGPEPIVNFADTEAAVTPDEAAGVHYETGPGPLLEFPRDHWRIVLVPGSTGKPTSLVYRIRGPAQRFTADLRPLPQAEMAGGAAWLVIRAGDKVVHRSLVRSGDGRVRLELPVSGADRLALSIRTAAGERALGVVLSAPWAHPR